MKADMIEAITGYYTQQKNLAEELSFSEYVARVQATPAIAMTAHQRLYTMIQAADVEETSAGFHYKFFDPYLIGADAQIAKMMEYIRGAAEGLDVRKRILLLIGPPAAGKSTSVIALKRGLDAFSRTDAGALYAIKDCPLAEEPLHLIPHALRKTFPVWVEGDLCPVCQLRLQNEGLESFRVIRYVLDEQTRHGIGTFVPGTEKDMSLDDLVGELDYSKIAEYGSDSDPRAFRFDGELDIANRGLMEFQEILKATPQMLYVLLGLASERTIKTQGFALISADEVVIGHTNLNEYDKFLHNKENEAIANRMFVVKMPYVLKKSEEAKIYDKMLHEMQWNNHVSPHVLENLALFTVISRLQEPKNKEITTIMKAQLYDGEVVGEVTDYELYELKREFRDEGMTGLSPRNAMDVFAHASHVSSTCTTDTDMLRALREWIESGQFLSMVTDTDIETLMTYWKAVTKEYNKKATVDVQTAFVHAFEDSAQALFENYLENASAYAQRSKIIDPVSGTAMDPDTKFMVQIENYIGVSENAAGGFREEILIRQGTALRSGNPFQWDSHPRLKEAISAKLFEDSKSIMVTNLTTRTMDKKQTEQRTEVMDRLKGLGYCTVCAEAALKYVGELMRRQ